MSNGHEVAPRPLKELVAFLCYGRNQKGAGDSWGYAPNGQLNQGGYLLTNAGTHINGSEKGNNSDANGSNSGNSSSASGNSSGDATSSSNGLFSGGVEGGSGVVDMRLLPETRTRGTVQFLMAGTKVVRISHTTPRPPPGKRSPTADVLGAYAEGSSSVRGYGEDDETKFEGLDVEEFQDVEDDKHGIGTVHETLLRSEKAKTARRTLRYMFAEWGWVEARRAPTNQMLRFADLPIGTSGGAGDGTFTHLRKTVRNDFHYCFFKFTHTTHQRNCSFFCAFSLCVFAEASTCVCPLLRVRVNISLTRTLTQVEASVPSIVAALRPG